LLTAIKVTSPGDLPERSAARAMRWLMACRLDHIPHGSAIAQAQHGPGQAALTGFPAVRVEGVQVVRGAYLFHGYIARSHARIEQGAAYGFSQVEIGQAAPRLQQRHWSIPRKGESALHGLDDIGADA